ncbi:helix-turn-helix domain-containing protein [Streptomyces sp. MST-110588]|uniref:helix-turn-helix domain-containing protein n=1 Tax=Streptomyces sp. MST-110588 TaxID=2833628 RepID=UPI003242D265
MTETQRSGYTIVGNQLAQHKELSALAIGLATYIQSLPDGASVSVRELAERFPEGRARVAAAMRLLESHGFIERARERGADGRIHTVTYSYNDPKATRARRAREALAGDADRAVGADAVGCGASASAATSPTVDGDLEDGQDVTAPSEPVPAVAAAPAVPRAAAPLPRPRTASAGQESTALALLANLRCEEPRLLLSVREVHRLAPAVAAWLERGAAPEAVRRTLTAGLPQELRHPAGFLAHRLTALLPPAIPPGPVPAASQDVRPDPLQTCDGCERAFRAPQAGRCRDCRGDAGAGATAVAGTETGTRSTAERLKVRPYRPDRDSRPARDSRTARDSHHARDSRPVPAPQFAHT